LMDALLPEGWAHSLVEYGRSGQFALDMQLRGYANKEHWATLYVGLTKVLDLKLRNSDRWHLTADRSYRKATFGWSPAWEHAQPGRRLAEEWDAVEDYLERVIPSVGERHYRKEGA